ncbi:hypothetical protein GCM10009844_16460 [Nocardioides koreensis]|uniref:Uncharacterized protein n=1 Tax=Nocardioides koreensis TaxID=433651 RepID=A0ABP5L9A5_9ACTN
MRRNFREHFRTGTDREPGSGRNHEETPAVASQDRNQSRPASGEATATHRDPAVPVECERSEQGAGSHVTIHTAAHPTPRTSLTNGPWTPSGSREMTPEGSSP